MTKKHYIFLHGGPGFSNYLMPFFQDLKTAGNLIFYDQLKGPKISIEDLIQQLDEIINGLEGEKILVGHSWGATLALEYVSRFEKKVSSLVLMSSGISFSHWKNEFEIHKQEQGLTEAPPEFLFLSGKERKEWTPFLNSLWDSFSDETFEGLYNGFIQSHDLTSTFQSISIPILYIYGSEDHRFPLKVARIVASLNKKIETLEVQDAGHFPFLIFENRKMVVQRILDFTSNMIK